MNQHKLDLESLERKHTLDLETREKEHKYQLEIMEKENQNAIMRLQQEQQNGMQNSLFQGLAGGFGNMLSGVLDSDEVKEQIAQSMKESFNKQRGK